MSTYILTNTTHAFYAIGDEFLLGGNVYTVKDKRLVKGNLLNNGGFAVNTANWNDHLVNVSGNGDVELYMDDYIYNRQCIRLTSDVSGSDKSIGIESNLYTGVGNDRIYNFDFHQKSNELHTTSVKFLYYQNNSGTYCSTSSASIALPYCATWQQRSLVLLGHNKPYGRDIDRIPSDCTYVKFRMYSSHSAKYASDLLLDGMKFSESTSGGMKIFSEPTADAMAIIPQENLVETVDDQTIFYLPFNEDIEAAIGTVSLKATADYAYRTHSFFDLMSGGIVCSNKYKNLIPDNTFSTSEHWNTHMCSMSVSSSVSYDPLFGNCARIYGHVAEHTSYIYATCKVTDSSAYWVSFYARTESQYGGHIVCQASTNALTSSVFAVSQNWQRYKLYHEASGTDFTYKVGAKRDHKYNYYVDGILIEPYSTGFPSTFNHFTGSTGWSAASFVKYHLPNEWFFGTMGAVHVHYVPDYDSDQMTATAHIFIAYDSTNAVTVDDDKMEIFFDGADDKFKVKTYEGSSIKEITGGATSFSAGTRIHLTYTWKSNGMGLFYVNTDIAQGTIYRHAMSAFQLGGMYVSDTDFRNPAYGSYTEFSVSSAFFSSADINTGSYRSSKPAPTRGWGLGTALMFSSWEHVGTRERQEDGSDPLAWTHNDVEPNRYYEYRIKCYDRDGNLSEFSDTAGITAGDYYAPDIVSATGSVGDYGGIKFVWKNPSDTDFKGINIYDDNGLVSKRHGAILPKNAESEYYFSTPDQGYDKFVYVTTIDHHDNESDPVAVYGQTLSIDTIVYGYSSPNPNDRREGKWFRNVKYKKNVTEYDREFGYSFYITFDETVTALTHDLKRPNGSTISPVNKTNTDATISGGIHKWLCKGVVTAGTSLTGGMGAIRLDYTKGGQSTVTYVPINFDADYPDIDNTTGISVEEDTGVQMTNSIRVVCPFTAAHNGDFDASSKLDFMWIDVVHADDISGYTFFATEDQGFRIPYLGNYSGTDVKVPVIIGNKIGTHTLKVRAYDVAQNYWEYGDSVEYTYTGSDIKFSWWSDLTDDINENGWLNDDVSSGYIKCTASVSSGDEIVRLTHHFHYIDSDGNPQELGTVDTDPWDGLVYEYSAWGAILAAYEGRHFCDLIAYSKLGKTKEITVEMKIDNTDPVITSGDILDEDNSHLKNRQVTIVINKDNISDAYSGYWKTHIYRKIDDEAWPSNPVVVLSGDHTVFTDSDERLEGYRTYTYRGIAYDNAGNSKAGTDDLEFLMTPDWEFTYRNKLNNGSFELYQDQFTDGAIESWDNSFNAYDTTVNERRIAVDTSCFGGVCMFMYSGGATDYITNSIFIEETTMRPPNYILSLYERGDVGRVVDLLYWDYKNESLGSRRIRTVDWSGGGAGNSYVGADGATWYRRWYLLDPDDWTGFDTAQCTLMDVKVFNTNGSNYLDGVMFEAGITGQTTPSTFRDNRVLTTDRFEAGYIYGNMIKGAQIHGGHIHADGISVVDSDLGAPSITVGEYADDKTFIRMTDASLYYHPSSTGQDKEEGMFFAKHIEGDHRVWWLAGNDFNEDHDFKHRYTNWAGAPINPHFIICPTMYPAYSASLNTPSGETDQYHHFVAIATAGQYMAHHYLLSTPDINNITPTITSTYGDSSPSDANVSPVPELPHIVVDIGVTFAAGTSQWQWAGGRIQVYKSAAWSEIGQWDMSVTEYSGTVYKSFDFDHLDCVGCSDVRVIFDRRGAGGGASDIASVVFKHLVWWEVGSYEKTSGITNQYEFLAMDGGLFEGY